MWSLYLGIALISASSLAFEISLTRIFALAQWYHFAFMSVSVALLGFGASGSLLSLFPGLKERKLERTLALLAFLFSLSIIASYLGINYLPFDAYRVAWERRQLLYLAAYYLALAVPFLLAGLSVGLVLAAVPAQVKAIYGANLIGSGLGCLWAVAMLSLVGAPSAVILAAFLGMLAAALLTYSASKLYFGGTLLVAGLLLLTALRPPSAFQVRLSPYKSLSYALRVPGAKLAFSRWNAFSRVDVVESPSIRSAPGLSLNYMKPLPFQVGLAVDGNNLTPITSFQGDLEFLDHLPINLAYRLAPRNRVAIVEPGGGLDVLVALRQEAQRVTVIESNPLVAAALQGPYGEFSGHIFSRPEVLVATENARSFLRRSPERYDLVVLSLSEGFRVVSSGAYSLSENYLLTHQAFREYLEHLEEDGILAILRWLQVPPSECVRAAVLAIEALESLGVAQPGEHIVAIRDWATALILVKRTPFTPEEVEMVREFSRQGGYDPIWLPGVREEEVNRYNVLAEPYHYQALREVLDQSKRGKFLADYYYDLSPPSDDRPFFFHFFRWRQVPDILRGFGKTWQPFGGSGYLALVALILVALLASAGLILTPLLARRAMLPRRHRLPALAYFSLLGLGYLLVEIPLMQRFILFLGHPIYAFTAVLFALLIFSGLGSLASARLPLGWTLVAISLGAILYLPALAQVLPPLMGQALPLRLALTVALLAPLGLPMGVPFPSGISLLERTAPGLIPWAWAVNGCASVVSSVLAAMLALSFGFSWVLVGAASAYLLASLALRSLH